jgi:hypothetical protein
LTADRGGDFLKVFALGGLQDIVGILTAIESVRRERGSCVFGSSSAIE